MVARVFMDATVPPRDLVLTRALPKPHTVALWILCKLASAAQRHYTNRNSLLTEVLQIAGGVLLASFVEWSGHFDANTSFSHRLTPWIVMLLLIPWSDNAEVDVVSVRALALANCRYRFSIPMCSSLQFADKQLVSRLRGSCQNSQRQF